MILFKIILITKIYKKLKDNNKNLINNQIFIKVNFIIKIVSLSN
jgi:hypothetical protein